MNGNPVIATQLQEHETQYHNQGIDLVRHESFQYQPYLNCEEHTLMQWTGEGANNHYYLVDQSNYLRWSDAKSEAEKKGGYLATLTSQEEMDFVINQVQYQRESWIGGSRDDQGN